LHIRPTILFCRGWQYFLQEVCWILFSRKNHTRTSQY